MEPPGITAVVCWGLLVGKERSECQDQWVNLVGESVASFLMGQNRGTHFIPISWKHVTGRTPGKEYFVPPCNLPSSFRVPTASFSFFLNTHFTFFY